MKAVTQTFIPLFTLYDYTPPLYHFVIYPLSLFNILHHLSPLSYYTYTTANLVSWKRFLTYLIYTAPSLHLSNSPFTSLRTRTYVKTTSTPLLYYYPITTGLDLVISWSLRRASRLTLKRRRQRLYKILIPLKLVFFSETKGTV